MEKEIVIERMDISKLSKSDNSYRAIFERMEVGDTFLVDLGKANSLRNCAHINFKHTSKIFRSTVKGQPKGKVRFWREK